MSEGRSCCHEYRNPNIEVIRSVWRAKAWYLERAWPEDFGPVAHRFLVKEVPAQPVPAPVITVIEQRVDESTKSQN